MVWIDFDITGFTMIAMAKKKPKQPDGAKDSERSPFWAIFARIDPDLKLSWERYCADFHAEHGQRPEIGAFIQTLMRAKFKSTGHYPPPVEK
jgi:hypothetical protein